MKRFLIGVLVAGSLFATGAIAESVPNTLGKIKAAKTINVAFAGNALPFSFVGTNNEPAGYSIDLCKRVIARIGQAVGQPNLKVNWLAGSTAGAPADGRVRARPTWIVPIPRKRWVGWPMSIFPA